MKYLQPDLVEAYRGDSTKRGGIQFIEHRRPLRTLEAGEIEASLRKKNNKSRINRLKRSGELSFRRVTETAEQLDLLRELVPLYDFRQGAVNRTTPFSQDPQKLHYFQQLIEKMGEHMHLTGMWLDGELVSAHMGYIAADAVQMAIICHSPVHASYSPGRAHLLYLLELLQAEGFSHFDLTPGGDSWKDRSASFTDTVFELVHYTSPLQGGLADVSRVTNNLARRAIRGLGIDSAGLKRTVKRSRRLLRQGKPGNILRRLASEVELRVYSIQSRDPTPTVNKFRKNCLEDLLKFEAVESWQDKYDFLSVAMRRLASGEIAYSHADHDRLLSYFWLIPSARKAVFSEVKQGIRLPEGSAVQYDAFTHPASRGKGLYQAAMTEGLSDAFQQHQATRVFVGVVSTNAASRHVIEKVGYTYNGSLHYSHWLRRVKMRFELPEHYRLED
jgi:RimJ/RimL family protein N-acetyltransferase